MSEREYVRALNTEILKLNEIIDRKIIHQYDYRREARRHKILLAQIRRNEARRSLNRLWQRFFPIWG
jgi:hypothetical protein